MTVITTFAPLAALLFGFGILPFLDRGFARHFDPKNRKITWARTFGVQAVALAGTAVLCAPIGFIPSDIARFVLACAVAVAVRTVAIRKFFETDWATAFGTTVLDFVSLTIAGFALATAFVGLVLHPVVTLVAAAIGIAAWYANHRHDMATRRALGAA